MRILTFVVAGSLLGCATARPCPHRGGPPWRELQSEHFVVRTDLSAERARSTVERLELYRKILLVTASEDLDPAQKIEVFLPESAGNLKELIEGGDPHGYEPFSLNFDPDPLLVLSGDAFGPGSKELPNLVAMRLARLLTRSTLERAPRWFEVGWAIYQQSATIDDGLSQVEIGYPLGFLKNLQVRGIGFHKTAMDLQKVWASEGEVPSALHFGEFYEWAYFLRMRHPDRLAQLVDRFARGEEPRLAWDRTFAGVGEEELETQARAFVAPGVGYGVQTVPIPVVKSAPIAERQISDAEVHLLRARAARVMPTRKRGRLPQSGELAQTSGLEDHVAFELVLLDRTAIAPADAAQLAERYPQSARAQLAFAIAAWSDSTLSDRRLKAVERTVAADPVNAWAQLLLARELDLRGDHVKAITAATTAARLAPWSASTASMLAYTLARANRCPDAVAKQRRARELLDEQLAPDRIAKVNARLAQFEAECSNIDALSPVELGLE